MIRLIFLALLPTMVVAQESGTDKNYPVYAEISYERKFFVQEYIDTPPFQPGQVDLHSEQFMLLNKLSVEAVAGQALIALAHKDWYQYKALLDAASATPESAASARDEFNNLSSQMVTGLNANYRRKITFGYGVRQPKVAIVEFVIDSPSSREMETMRVYLKSEQSAWKVYHPIEDDWVIGLGR